MCAEGVTDEHIHGRVKKLEIDYIVSNRDGPMESVLFAFILLNLFIDRIYRERLP